MKFSVFTLAAPEYRPAETVNLLKELGYDGVEWRVGTPPRGDKPENYKYEFRYWDYNLSTIDIETIMENSKGIKSMCDDAGLEICCLATYLGLWDIDGIEKVIKAAVEMKCGNIRLMPPPYHDGEGYRELFDRSIQQVKTLEELAGSYGIRINLEMHQGGIIPSASAAYRLVAGCCPKKIGIIYDLGNMVHEGFENYWMGVSLLGEYLAHVHVKNAVWKLENITEAGVEIWRPQWIPFKKGYADIARFIRILKDINYTGFVSVEDFSNEEDTYNKLRNNINFLRSL